MSELANVPVKLTAEVCAQIAAKPLRMLPLEWRGEVWKFWAFWSHLIPTHLALAVRLTEWIQDGLTLEDARRVFEIMTRTDTAAEVRFPGVLLAEFARRCRERIEARRRDERARKQDAEHRVRYPRRMLEGPPPPPTLNAVLDNALGNITTRIPAPASPQE